MLLVTSMVFAVGSWATETLFVIWELQHRCHWRRISFTIIWELVLIWLYVPLIWIQSYTLKRTILRCAPTLVDEGGIGNYSMDLATIFVGMKPLVILYSATTTQYRALTYAPGIIQSCLVIYIGARYAWSFSKVIPRYARLNRCADFFQLQLMASRIVAHIILTGGRRVLRMQYKRRYQNRCKYMAP